MVNLFEGSFAIIVMMKDYPNYLLLARRSSPLSLGIGENQMFIASDVLAYADKTKKALFMPDESFALVCNNSIQLYDFFGKALPQEHTSY